VDGLCEFPGAPGAAAELVEYSPCFELRVRAFAGGAEFRVGAVGFFLRVRLVPASVRDLRPGAARPQIGPHNPLTAPFGYNDQIGTLLERGGVDLLAREMLDERVTELAVAGNPDEVAERIQACSPQGRGVVLSPVRQESAAAQLQLCAETVFPWFGWRTKASTNLRSEAPCHIPGAVGRNLEDIPGSDGLPGSER
jgi:hypothetical protein